MDLQAVYTLSWIPEWYILQLHRYILILDLKKKLDVCQEISTYQHFVVARIGSFDGKCLTLQRNGANHSPRQSIMKKLLKKVTDLIVRHSAAKVWLFSEKESIQVTLWDHDDQYKFDFYDFAKKEWKRTFKCLSEFITIIEQKGGLPC